jgi:hypothetical protein
MHLQNDGQISTHEYFIGHLRIIIIIELNLSKPVVPSN